MVKTKKSIFSIMLCLILCAMMVFGGIKIAGGRNVSAEDNVIEAGEYKLYFENLSSLDFDFLQIGDFIDTTKVGVFTFANNNYDDVYFRIINGTGGEPLFSYWIVMRTDDIEYFQIKYEENNGDKIKIMSDCYIEGWYDDGSGIQYSKEDYHLMPEIYFILSEDYEVENLNLFALLNKLLIKIETPVEETGVDLYGVLAISGAMLILACGCAVVMSKMKRKQSI
ncbi:MAG: hypothetical protein KBT30_00285 [Clostridiales bacterium]|nr:hypothetical protein [Candidatus Apopatousia equi]